MSGVRKSFHEEFNYVYIINLRGGIRGLSKEEAAKEGKNVFDIMTSVAIIILVRDDSQNHKINYADIGD